MDRHQVRYCRTIIVFMPTPSLKCCPFCVSERFFASLHKARSLE